MTIAHMTLSTRWTRNKYNRTSMVGRLYNLLLQHLESLWLILHNTKYMRLLILMWDDWYSCEIIDTHVRLLILMWDDWYSCEIIDTHVRLLILMWDDWYSCEMIDTHVRLLILMWDYWYSCEIIDTHVRWLILMWDYWYSCEFLSTQNWGNFWTLTQYKIHESICTSVSLLKHSAEERS